MQRMPRLRSAAFSLLLPAGTADEPADRLGLASIAVEMMQRGAGARSSRDVIEDLDFLGVERDSGVSVLHSSFSAAAIDRYIFDALAIYVDIVRRAHLPADELDEAQAIALQELAGLQDDPPHVCFRRLRRLRYGDRFGRDPSGEEDCIPRITIGEVRDFYRQRLHADGSVLSIAGNIDFAETVDRVYSLLGDWESGDAAEKPEIGMSAGYEHIHEETSQTQIAIAFDAVPFGHDAYYASRALINILGDGMSSRLFTEVREKRGLVYSVSASTQTVATRSSAVLYAGTTSARAAETLQVIWDTVRSLADGVTEDELRLLKSRLVSSLIFEQESCVAQATQNAADWFHRGRIIDSREVLARFDSLTTDELLEHAVLHPPANRTLVTLGDTPLETADAI